MFDLTIESQNGTAARFLDGLQSARHSLEGIELSDPILRLVFEDGQTGSAFDFEDVPGALFNCLTHYYDLPHLGWLPAMGHILFSAQSYTLELAYEGLDGPLIVRFEDGSTLASNLRAASHESKAVPSWESALEDGSAQARMEAVVSLAYLSRLTELLDTTDREVAEALLIALSRLTKTDSPPRRVVVEIGRWLLDKSELFIDEAVKMAGRVTGGAAVGIAAYQVNKHFPSLRDQLIRLIQAAG